MILSRRLRPSVVWFLLRTDIGLDNFVFVSNHNNYSGQVFGILLWSELYDHFVFVFNHISCHSLAFYYDLSCIIVLTLEFLFFKQSR